MSHVTEQSDPLSSLHTFAVDGHAYAVDGASAAAFDLDEHALRALNTMTQVRSPDPTLGKDAEAQKPESAVARRELEQLRGYLARSLVQEDQARRRACTSADPSGSLEVCLCATLRCNLACEYCFVRGDHQERATALGDMTLGTARAAIDFALEKLPAPTGELVFSFGHTGEPMLVRDTYIEAREYAQRRAVEMARKVSFGMGGTNLTLTGTEDFCLLPWPAVSLDGPREVHDRVRRSRDGKPTYDLVASALRELLLGYPQQAAETNLLAAITADSTDIRGIFLHLASFGAPYVSLNPVRLPPTSRLAITETSASRLLAGYDELLKHLLASEDPDLLGLLMQMIHYQDYFGRFVLRVALGQRGVRRCGAGDTMFAVLPSGDVHPCPELAATQRLRMGSIWEGLDSAVMRQLQSRRVWDSAACGRCWARLLCGGECLHAKAIDEASGAAPGTTGICILTRGLIERAIHLVSRLRAERASAMATVLEARAPRPSPPGQERPRMAIPHVTGSSPEASWTPRRLERGNWRPASPRLEPEEYDLYALYRVEQAASMLDVLQIALRLKLFDVLDQGAGTVGEIASSLGIAERPARALIVACAALGLIGKQAGRYCNLPEAAERLVSSGRLYAEYARIRDGREQMSPRTVARFQSVLINTPCSPAPWLPIADRQGVPIAGGAGAAQHTAHQTARFLSREVHQERKYWGEKLAEIAALGAHRQIVDLGGATGGHLEALLERFDHLQGVLFDLPYSLEAARSHLRSRRVASRVHYHAGDFFSDPFPEHNDAFLMCHVLHDWSEGNCIKLLRKCWEALPPGGMVMGVEFPLNDEEAGPTVAALEGLYVLYGCMEGEQRTGPQICALLAGAGFAVAEPHAIDTEQTLFTGSRP